MKKNYENWFLGTPAKVILLILFATLLFAKISDGQSVLTEKEVIKKEHIDFSKEVIMFKITGLIECGRHTFLNDTCQNPVYYYSNLDEVIFKLKDNSKNSLTVGKNKLVLIKTLIL